MHTYIHTASGCVEKALADAASPSDRGKIVIDGAKLTASYDTGHETITKSLGSIALCVGWIVQMEAARKAGSLKKGMQIIQKKNPSLEATQYTFDYVWTHTNIYIYWPCRPVLFVVGGVRIWFYLWVFVGAF